MAKSVHVNPRTDLAFAIWTGILEVSIGGERMALSGTKLAIVAALIFSGAQQSWAQDVNQILNGILGAGAGIILNEMNRERRQSPQVEERPFNNRRKNTLTGGLTEAQIHDAQVRLNELGYDIGTPDGQYGSRTRGAIRRYQNDVGAPTTGTLTGAQFTTLVRTPAASPSVNPDDIPLNQNEMAELQRGLITLGFDIGKADGKAGRQTGAAISKVLTDRGLDPYQVPIREAQRLIIADAAAKQPETGSVAERAEPYGGLSASDLPGADSAVLLVAKDSNASSDTLEKQMDEAGLTVDWTSGIVGYGDDRATFGRELLRRIIKAQPELLDSRSTLANWLRDLAYGARPTWPAPEVLAFYKQYSEGDEFDQERALEGFKDFLSSKATDEPLRVLRIRRATVGRYDNQTQGFPLGLKGNEYDFADRMYFSWGGQPGVDAVADDWNDVARLPATPRAAEKITKTLGQMRYADVAVRMALSEFALKKSAAGARIEAIGKIERVSAHYVAKRGEGRIGPLIALMPTSEEPTASEPTPALPDAANPLESWVALGAKTSGSRLSLMSTSANSTGPTDAALALGRPLELFALSAQPKTARTIANVYHFSANFLTRQQHASIFAKKIDFKFIKELNNDEFRRKDIIDRFDREFFPALVARAPKVPVNVRFGHRVRIGRYDFKTKSFPLHGLDFVGKGDRWAWLVENMSIETDLADVPREIFVEEAKAREFTAALRADADSDSLPAAYAGIEATLTRIDAGYSGAGADNDDISLDGSSHVRKGNIDLATRVTRIVLYQDAAMTRPLIEIPVAAIKVAQHAAPPPDPLPNETVGPGTTLSSWALVGVAARSGAGEEFMVDAARTSQAFAGADEFSRKEVLDQIVRAARQTTPSTDAVVFVPGTMKLMEHDGASGFEVADARFAMLRPEDPSPPANDVVRLVLANPETVARLPVAASIGRALVAVAPDRTFQALYRVKLGRADREASTTGPKANISFEVEEVLLLHPRDPNRVIVRAPVSSEKTPALQSEAKVQSEVKKPAESGPDRMPLTGETLALLMIKHSGKEADDVTLRWLLIRRWQEEDNDTWGDVEREPHPWGRFFPRKYREPTEADVERFMPAFRKWTAQRVATLPQKLMYRRSSDYQSIRFARQGRAGADFAPVLEQIGVSRRDPILSARAFEFATSETGATILKGGILSFNRDGSLNGTPEVYLALADLPAPKVMNEYVLSADLDIRHIGVSPGQNGSPPSLAIDAAATEVRWWGEKTAVTPRKLVAKIAVKPVPPREPITEKPLDMVGLKLGMPLADAEAALDAQMKVDRILELAVTIDEAKSAPTIARLYVREDGMELVAALYGSGARGKSLLGASRVAYLPKDSVTQAQMGAVLEKKYGEPFAPQVWAWGKTADVFPCAEIGSPDKLPWRESAVLRGKSLMTDAVSNETLASDVDLAREARITRRADYMTWGFRTRSEPVDRCGPVFRAQFQASMRLGYAGEVIPDEDTALLMSWLFDAQQLGKAAEASRNSKADEVKIDVKL